MDLNIIPGEHWKPGMTGIFSDVPIEKYHTEEAGLNAGTAKTLLYKSPAHAKHRLDNPEVPTPAMKMGTLVHVCTLEPDKFEASYHLRPDGYPVGGKLKKWHASATWCEEWTAKHSDRIIIASKELEKIHGCRHALLGHSMLRSMLEVGHTEVSVFAKVNGTIVKCRPDLIAESADGGCWVLDIKKCQDAERSAFERQSRILRRDFTEAWYRFVLGLVGIPISGFIFAGVEEDPPHGVALFRISAQNIDRMKPEVQRALDVYEQCRDRVQWPGFSEEITMIEWGNYET